MHADPPIFHRDITWPNIVQDLNDSSKWFLIDFDEASFQPTHAAPRLDPETHYKTVFEDNHGPEVDLWAVGNLVTWGRDQPWSMRAWADRLKHQTIGTAQEALEELLRIESDHKQQAA